MDTNLKVKAEVVNRNDRWSLNYSIVDSTGYTLRSVEYMSGYPESITRLTALAIELVGAEKTAKCFKTNEPTLSNKQIAQNLHNLLEPFKDQVPANEF